MSKYMVNIVNPISEFSIFWLLERLSSNQISLVTNNYNVITWYSLLHFNTRILIIIGNRKFIKVLFLSNYEKSIRDYKVIDISIITINNTWLPDITIKIKYINKNAPKLYFQNYNNIKKNFSFLNVN